MSLEAKKLTSALKVTMYDFDPDATAVTAVAWVDMRDIYKLLVGVMRTVGSSVMTLIIEGNTASDGSGDGATIVTKTFTAGQPDDVGDYVFLEVLAEQIRQKGEEDGKEYRYAAAKISFATGTDEAAVAYVAEPRFAYEDLTADYILS